VWLSRSLSGDRIEIRAQGTSMIGFRGAGLAIAMACMLIAAGATATQYWELSPVADPAIAIGTYTSVGGKTAPDGVSFTLKDNSADQPIALTLISSAPSVPLHLSAFKGDGESFLDKDTDAKGMLTVRFRTADTIHFKVAGAAGSSYQLSVWRGPAVALPAPDPIVAMDALTGRPESAAPAAAGATGAASAGSTATASSAAMRPATPPPAASASGMGPLVYILLGGILFVLVVIALLLLRGQRMRGKS
jgi:hypothetical protein